MSDEENLVRNSESDTYYNLVADNDRLRADIAAERDYAALLKADGASLYKSLDAALAALKVAREALEQFEKAKRFIQDAFTCCTIHGCDYGGGDMQDTLEELGIIELTAQSEHCGVNCNCVKMQDGPTYHCYQLRAEFKADRAALAQIDAVLGDDNAPD